jgi:acyl transferase domain-containing protein/acyl carrier protein
VSAPSAAVFTPLQQAALSIKQLRARVDALEGRRREPIAVVGLGCRFPGASNPAEYWDLLERGRDAIREIPPERWDMDALYDPDPDAPGRMYTRRAGLLDGIDRFDPYFFGISPREAQGMDPQQRLLLEVAWEALEDAGESPEGLRGSRSGVFIGLSSSDFMQHLLRRGPQNIDAWLGTGSAPSAAVGRLSYLLGLEGPSMAVDTACSSSLVAVHQACRSLRDGECDLALAGGVNLILTPELSVAFCKAGMLSPDGRCKTFDAAADGYVRAEGCGVVVLKRLTDALRGGDRVLALVRGSAVNQDGRSSGLTVPNGSSQQRVVREALAAAGIEPAAVSFVETHGTGTSIGDPIEVQALAAALGEGRTPDRPVLVGAVKSQIGHLEAGAGIAGLIKVVLALRHDRLPGQLHFHTPNPHVPWAELPLQVVERSRDWPKGQRVAGVSAFGFSGTNAHVVLAEPPSTAPVAADETPPGFLLLQLSAREPAALRGLVERYVAWLHAYPAANLTDLCYTAARGRAHWEERLALPARSSEQLAGDLGAWLAGERPAGCRRGRVAMGGLGSGARFVWSSAAESELAQACAAYVEGRAPAKDGTLAEPQRRKLGLPTYPFQRERYWPDAPRQVQPPARGKACVLERRYAVDAFPFLADHRVRGALVLPAALLVEVARQAARESCGCGPVTAQGFRIEQAALIGDQGRLLRVECSALTDDGAEFEIRTRVPGDSTGWIRNALGRILRPDTTPAPRRIDRTVLEARCATPMDISGYYAELEERGFGLGPAFRMLASLLRGDSEAVSRLVLPEAINSEEQRRTLFLDGALQTVGALLPPAADGQAYLPVAFERIAWPEDAELTDRELFCHATLHVVAEAAPDSLSCDLALFDAAGEVRLLAVGVRVQRMSAQRVGADRTSPLPRDPVRDFRVELARTGSIDELRLVPWECPPPCPGEVQLEVRACGLNFRDLVGVLGILPGYEHLYGGECAGRVRLVGEGVTRFCVDDAVLGFAEGCIGGRTNVDARLLAGLPAGLGDEDAATVPVSFISAWYGLKHLAGLRAGERVLIHSAAGGLGLAAVQVAQFLGAEIFATASPAKWEHLRGLGIEHLADSRSPEFAGAIRREAGPRGIDAVLNSLPAERIGDNLSLLAPGGRFIEMGQLGIWSSERVAAERPDVAYHVMRLDRMLAETPELAGALLAEVLEQMQAGRLRPLPRRVFPIDRVRRAFRAMQQGRHIGKLLLAVPADGVRLPDDAKRPKDSRARGAHRDYYVQYVRELTARILGWSADRLPDPQTGFLDLGLDSLMAVELRNRLQSELGPAVKLSATIGFDYPTIEDLGNHLAAQLAAPAQRPICAPAAIRRQEPIAVVGMACRFPGGARDLEAYWRLLRDGVDAVTDFPAGRASLAGLYDPDPATPGKTYSRHGAFLDAVDQFDNDFFGIAPREAVSMDPQQRLLLEVAWEALEHAGIAADRMAGGATGVFIGLCSGDYKDLLLQRAHSAVDAYLATGTSGSVAAGRISYLLGLHGPSLTIDTACSSALVAVHEACQSLRVGECSAALAGGANIVLSPQPFLALSKARMISATGRCHTFDAAADGYVRGEGVGVVVLRRLEDALADGDRVLAVIRGSAVNQDGRSSGLTAPNGVSQQAVIRQALAHAGVEPAAVAYLEAHGTGTPLGDPIEVQAAAAALGEGRAPDRPLLIGSVKANIGHGEGAAGIAGLIKLVLALDRGALPPQIHIDTLNPKIDWGQLPVRVVRELSPWPDGPRLGGVSSFGFSGTNAHLLLSEPPQRAIPQASEVRGPCVLCLSARDEGALRELAQRYLEYMECSVPIDLAELCFSAAQGRRHWDERLALVAGSIETLRERLRAWIEQGQAPGAWRGRAAKADTAEADAPACAEDLAKAYVRGGPAEWSLDTGSRDSPRQLRLPSYPFQRKRFWFDSGSLRRVAAEKEAIHPLLGAPVISPDRYTFESGIQADRPAWLQDHRVLGSAVFPAAGFVEMALAAAGAAWGETPTRLEAFEILQPLVLFGPCQVQLVLVPDPSAARAGEVRILGHCGDRLPARPSDWKTHARGRVRALSETPPSTSLETVRRSCTRTQDVDAHYRNLAERGLDYGPAFRAVLEIWQGTGEALTRIDLPADARAGASGYRLHPLLLDACLQTVAAAKTQVGDDRKQVWLPASFDQVHLWHRPSGALFCHARLRAESPDRMIADLTLWDGDGAPIARLEGFGVRPAARRTLSRLLGADRADSTRYRLNWHQQARSPASGAANPPGLWWLIGDPVGLGHALCSGLEARGQRCLVLAADAASLEKLPAKNAGEPTLRGIVHLGALGWPAVDMDGAESLGPEVRRQFSALIGLLRELATSSAAAPRLWFLTRGAQMVGQTEEVQPQAAALWGLAKAAGMEQPQWRPVAIDLEQATEAAAMRVIDELLEPDHEDRIAYRGGTRYVARLDALTEATGAGGRLRVPERSYRLQAEEKGTLANLRLAPIDSPPPAAGEVQLAVRAAGLNFRDVLDTLGVIGRDLGPLGGECAGIVRALGPGVSEFAVGDAVMGLAPGCFAKHVNVPAVLVARQPAKLSAAQAATIPVTFATAWLALREVGGLKRGDRVLIHAAAGGVGLAAIQIARHLGAEIYATASTGKWAFLRSLGVSRIANSRSPDFAQTIRELSDGRGVDIVLNSLSGDYIGRSLSLLAPRGRFIEIGKRDIWTHRQMRESRPDVDYHIVALDQLTAEDPQAAGRLLRRVLALIEDGSLEALPHRIFELPDAPEAFRWMQQGRHTGKIVLRIPPEIDELPARATYLVTGGHRGLGLTAAKRLVERGARHVVLLGRREPDAEARASIAALEAQGAEVRAAVVDVADAAALAGLLQRMRREMPPLRGVIHSAGVLDDGVLAHQSWERFERVWAPKAQGAWNLHRLTRDDDLDFFVLYSSVASVLGSAGQSNYASANAFLEGLAQQRRARGLPVNCVAWGPWDEIGMSARLLAQAGSVADRGLAPIPVEAGLAALESMLRAGSDQTIVLRADWARYAATLSDGTPALLANLVRAAGPQAPATPAGSDLRRRLRGAPAGERARLLTEHVARETAQVLGKGPAEITDSRTGFLDLGMDSLMAVELRNRLQQALGQDVLLPVTLIFDFPTVERLGAYVAQQLYAPAPDAPVAQAQTQADDENREVDALSNEELRAMLDKAVSGILDG